MARKNTGEMEDLLRKSFELNRKFVKESFRIFNEVRNRGTVNKNLFTFNPDLYNKAVTTFSRMNLEYLNKMMDFGFTVADEVFFEKMQPNDVEITPSFNLSGTGVPGSGVNLSFVLENTKGEEVFCELKHSTFTRDTDMEVSPDISVEFSPQSFTQKAGESRTVGILLDIGKNVEPGLYVSDVRVLGFEPSYFTVSLAVEPPTSESADAKVKKRSKKK
jgi:hypothetical protein